MKQRIINAQATTIIREYWNIPVGFGYFLFGAYTSRANVTPGDSPSYVSSFGKTTADEFNGLLDDIYDVAVGGTGSITDLVGLVRAVVGVPMRSCR